MKLERIGAQHPLFDASFSLYESSFPPNERRTRADHLLALQDTDFLPLGAVEDDRLLADVFVWQTEDFVYLEHFAVQLLVERRDGEYCKTPLARQLSESFAFVLVDEYQDTNATQDMIFGSVSRPDNLFMVGDVKQSIYRFRQAMPEIFMEKLDRYGPFDGKNYPAKIILGKNFRSRPEVTEFVNFVFRQLMSQICFRCCTAFIYRFTDFSASFTIHKA